MARWDYKDIDYESINCENISGNEVLFQLIVIASFIEITSDLYEKNLVEFYIGDESLIKWLDNIWEPEEIQHGKALKKYVQTVWPSFNWEDTYKKFRDEYGALCTLKDFQPTKTMEMLARMVVETGTSTFYKALKSYAQDLDEPILSEIAANISKDEIYHYNMFEEGFKKYNKEEKLSRTDIMKVIYSRLKEVNDEDVSIAFKHICPDGSFENFKKKVKDFAKVYYPYKMSVKMLIRPLKLNQYIEKASASTIEKALKVIGI